MIGVATKPNDVTTDASPAKAASSRAMTIAYTLWLIAAVGLMTFGAMCIFASNATIYARVLGGIFVVAAAGVGLLAGKARDGEPRWQRAAVALSLTFALFQIVVVILADFQFWYLLLGAIVLLVAGTLVYRTNVDNWVQSAGK